MVMLVSRFLQDETGTTAIEYSIVAAGIALAIVATVQALGSVVFSWFSQLQSMP